MSTIVSNRARTTLVINRKEVRGWRKFGAVASSGAALFVAVVFLLAIIAGSATVALAAITSPIWIVAKMLGVA